MDDIEIVETDDDYYAFLNLPRDATLEQINAAYKHQSRIYHPDKHTDPAKKKDAEMIFNRLKTAHSVLSSPQDRQIYDLLGTKGLKAEGWQMIPRNASPSQIREEYERLAKEKEERRLQQLTNPKGNITIHVNCTDIFNSYETDYDEPNLFSRVEISGMTMFQSIEVPLDNNNVATLGGNLNVSNGQGQGRFSLSARRVLSSRGWIELDTGFGNGLSFGGKGSRSFGKRYFATGQLNFNMRQNGIVPSLVGSWAVQLDKHTLGYLTYTASGMQSSLSTILERNSEKYYVNLTMSIGLPHSFVSCNYIRRFAEQEAKLKLTGRVGTFGFLTEYGVEKKISKYSSVHASVMIGMPSGVTMKLRLMRSSQSYNFNIQLSEEIIPGAIFYATTLPLVTYFVVKKCILEPLENDKKRKVIEKSKEVNEEKLDQKKREAKASVSLMMAQYERIFADEERKNGLVILQAYYGKFEEEEGDQLDDMEPDNASTYIDVRIPLQCLVRDSQIKVHTAFKYDLPGFWDPAIGEDKVLKVKFKYGNDVKTVSIDDKDEIQLPN